MKKILNSVQAILCQVSDGLADMVQHIIPWDRDPSPQDLRIRLHYCLMWLGWRFDADWQKLECRRKEKGDNLK